ncbi:MAG TPA: DUF4386 domain-containing protein [Thermoanaerobaculia bacterium]|jgi:hypothetical protein|nr:DUF4386 domain-containing protein [Thermoanaerobaculia bacterium]
MTTDVLTSPLYGSRTAARALEPMQHTAARLAGFLYLLTNATAIFAFAIRGRLIVRGDVVRTAKNIAASERLFRAGIVAELVTIAAVIMLIVALYVVLKPVSRNVALLAAFWRLAENFILVVVVLSEFAVLRLLGGGDTLQAVDTRELQALAYTFLRVYGDGFRIGFMFLGLGSAAFAYLWLKSRYIPRWLAALGLVASLLMAVVEMSVMVFPDLASVVGMAYMAPMGLFEIGGGLWLLIKGIR